MPTRLNPIRTVLLVGLALWPAAAHAEDDPFAFFEAKVRPVLVERCYPCHGAEMDPPKGGLRLDTKEGLLRGGKGGPGLVPGNAEASRIIRAIRYADPDLQMPPKGKLSDAEIDALIAWVNSGAPDPRTGPAPKAAPKKAHWAFVPPVASAPPIPNEGISARTPIDQFLLAKLEENGLRPAPQADRRTLIRRVYFDLLGLPPDAAAVDRFVNDPDPQAFEKLVDELLASPHYGERWARHWLDVARYADTKGYVYPEREEARFFYSYVYRDWVIAALNRDLPYDDFLRYQIAGDQIPGPNGEDERAAMGFLTLGRRFLGVVHDIIDDRIDVVMRGTQAMTMGCARCHDHKFDPLTMHDYYGLYGVFAGSSERIVSAPGTAEDPRKTPGFEAEWHKRQADLRTEFTERKETLAALLRTQTDRYLDAALRASTFPSDEFYEIRGPDDLNPTIVWQWRRYLDRQADDDPVWGPWKQLEKLPTATFAQEAAALALDPAQYNPLVLKALQEKQPKSMEDAAAAYGAELLRVNQLWLDTQQDADKTDTPDPAGFDDPALEALRARLYAADSPVEAPKGPMVDVEWYFDEPSRLALTKRSKALETLLLTNPGATPHTLILEDKPEQRAPCVFKRGNPKNKGEEVARRFPAALGGSDAAPFREGSGRRELAEAIADRANPLTARVMVNRVWQWHFGEGLVRTTSDFGTRCEGPSHPELLDWLAVWFMDHGWSLKALHRLILTSAVWQQQSLADPETLQKDPENLLLTHFTPERLDFEEMRDALLAASGELAPEIGGKPVELFKAPFPPRRTLYGNIDRTFLQGAYRVFDFPNPDMHGPKRAETSVPQQALFFMNSPFLREQARALAKAVNDAPPGPERIAAMTRRVFQEPPAPEDAQRALDFIAVVPEVVSEPPPPPSPWKYGYGKFDANGQRVLSFTALPYFSGEAYQGGTAYPDGELGWVKLDATGGHPGNDTKHACIRRWEALAEGDVTVSGTVVHEPTEGDGIRAWIVSSTQGELFGEHVHTQKREATAGPLHVKPGDTLDFVVDISGGLGYDQFLWAPVVTFEGKTFDAKADFAPPIEARPVPMTAWEQYAQVLLLCNRFVFVD